MTGESERTRGGLAAGGLITGAVCLLALPSAVLAFTVNFEPVGAEPDRNDSVEVISGANAAPRLARDQGTRSLARGQLYPFTPAVSSTRPDRSITVAVRFDPDTARKMAVRAPVNNPAKGAERSEVRIAPTGFSLGVSRGYTNFAQNIVRSDEQPGSAIPDLQKYSIAGKKTADDSRFAPRIVMDETQSAGRTPRTFGGDSDDLVDVGGSYRVTKNLNVTAGVRYSQERERLLPVTDGKQDNQAVYVGTQFKF